MSNPRGRFVWYELMTNDMKAAEAFYSRVVGWEAQDAGKSSECAYTIFSVGELPVAGLMEVPTEARARGVKPAWVGYVGVEDVDDFALQVTYAGGAVRRAPDDIPGIGRFAVVADPQGAVFMLFKGSEDGQGSQPAPGKPGHIGWHELHAGEWQSAFAFYSKLFGWTKAEAVDLGAMGLYQTFATDSVPVGGMMTKVEAVPAPFWLYYFNVDDITAAVARVKDAGGQVLHGPQQVPGGSWIAHCLDPQGVIFALTGPGS